MGKKKNNASLGKSIIKNRRNQGGGSQLAGDSWVNLIVTFKLTCLHNIMALISVSKWLFAPPRCE